MGKVAELLERFKQLDQEKSMLNRDWQEIAEYFQPEKAQFYGVLHTAEDRIKIFNSAPEEAAGTLAAALQDLLTSAVHTWFNIDVIGQTEALSEEDKWWLEDTRERMMAKFNSDDGNFQSAVHEFWIDLPSFGTAIFFVDQLQQTVRFICIPLHECAVAENALGVIDTVFRSFEMTARQIQQRWPESYSSEVKSALEKNPEHRFKIIHAVYPRESFSPETTNPKKMRIASIYFECQSHKILSESGYQEMPFMVARWSKTSGQSYGRGPGHKTLPDVRVLNELSRSEMIAVDKAASPSVLIPHEGFVSEYDSSGDAVNYHRFNGDIREKIMTMGSEADLLAIRSAIQSKEDGIKRVFLNHKLQMVGGPQKTAAEVREIVKRDMAIMGPVAGRLQSEFLAPLIRRVFGLMYRNNELAPMPETLQNVLTKIQYVSPITQAQKQTEAEAIMSALSFLQPFMSMDQGLMDHFNLDALPAKAQKMFGFDNTLVRSKAEVEKIRKQRAEAQQQQQTMVAQQNEMALAQQAKDLRTNEAAA